MTENRILLLYSLSAETGNSSWSSCNIFFKILRYTSSENTVECHTIVSYLRWGEGEVWEKEEEESCFYIFSLDGALIKF